MTPRIRKIAENMLRAYLHFVDGKGTPLAPNVQEAVELAFKRVVLEFPNFDQAQISDWAEDVAADMQVRINSVQFPRRYAYMALKGRVRDWSRTGPGRAELKGLGSDLEEIAGHSKSHIDQTDREVLLRQVLPELNERDRAILILVCNGKSTVTIAALLNVNYMAAAKAMQRMKDRVSVVLNGKRQNASSGLKTGELYLARDRKWIVS